MSEDKQDLYPFKENPTKLTEGKEGAFATVGEFANNKKWIVKEYDRVNDDAYQEYATFVLLMNEFKKKVNIPMPPMTYERFCKEVVKNSSLLKNTKTDLSTFIPEYLVLYGQDNIGEQKGFILMQRVNGKEIEDLDPNESESIEIAAQLDRLVCAALDFYEETKSRSDRDSDTCSGFLPDIVASPIHETEYVPSEQTFKNIMFGTLAETTNTNNKLFLVDTYPLMPVSDDQSVLFDCLKDSIANLEKKYGHRSQGGW